MSTTTTDKFQDLATLDSKIPPNFMMNYQGKPYILKAGLEWKAAQVFGVGDYSLETEVIERSKEDMRIVVKATLTTPSGAKYSNYGEVNNKNINSMMAPHALHLAVTRAECRVLRMATACGYVSAEEMTEYGGEKDIAGVELPPTPEQAQTLLDRGLEVPKTQEEARKMILESFTKKEGK